MRNYQRKQRNGIAMEPLERRALFAGDLLDSMRMDLGVSDMQADQTVQVAPQQVTTPRVDAPLIDAPLIDAPLVDAPLVDAPLVDAPLVDAPLIDAPLIDAPLIDAPLIDAPLIDAPLVDAPRVDSPLVDTPRVDAPQIDAPQIDAPRVDAPRVDAPRVDVPPVVTPGPNPVYGPLEGTSPSTGNGGENSANAGQSNSSKSDDASFGISSGSPAESANGHARSDEFKGLVGTQQDRTPQPVPIESDPVTGTVHKPSHNSLMAKTLDIGWDRNEGSNRRSGRPSGIPSISVMPSLEAVSAPTTSNTLGVDWTIPESEWMSLPRMAVSVRAMQHADFAVSGALAVFADQEPECPPESVEGILASAQAVMEFDGLTDQELRVLALSTLEGRLQSENGQALMTAAGSQSNPTAMPGSERSVVDSLDDRTGVLPVAHDGLPRRALTAISESPVSSVLLATVTALSVRKREGKTDPHNPNRATVSGDSLLG